MVECAVFKIDASGNKSFIALSFIDDGDNDHIIEFATRLGSGEQLELVPRQRMPAKAWSILRKLMESRAADAARNLMETIIARVDRQGC